MSKKQEGYDEAMKEVEAYVEASIKKHNGARVVDDVMNVLNDVILHVHEAKLKRGVREARVNTMSYMTTQSTRGVLQ